MTALATPPRTARTGNSTTARTLRRSRITLLALTAAVLVTSFGVFEGVRRTVADATEHTIPSMMAASAASEALAEADSAAVHSFGTGQVLITGPGSEYQAQTSLAGQNLEQIAETSQAGQEVSERLLLIASQLTEYRQLIQQAHADYAAGSVLLGTVEMIYASRLLHDEVLEQLREVRDLERRGLDNQLSSFWMSTWALLAWLLPALALLAVLVRTQRYLSKRFRRTLNWWLAAGTISLIVVVGCAATAWTSESQLGDARSSVEELVAGREPEFAADANISAVAARLNQECTTNHTTCGQVTMAATEPELLAKATETSERAAAAGDSNGLEFVIPALGLGIAVLVLLGLQPRVQEYRYRSR